MDIAEMKDDVEKYQTDYDILREEYKAATLTELDADTPETRAVAKAARVEMNKTKGKLETAKSRLAKAMDDKPGRSTTSQHKLADKRHTELAATVRRAANGGMILGRTKTALDESLGLVRALLDAGKATWKAKQAVTAAEISMRSARHNHLDNTDSPQLRELSDKAVDTLDATKVRVEAAEASERDLANSVIAAYEAYKGEKDARLVKARAALAASQEVIS